MSSIKSLMLDYGLPSLAMVGAGLLTFMLTGGPEEFPSTEPPDEGEGQEDDADYADSNVNEESEESLMLAASITAPKWADELAISNAKMVEELRLLKEANQAQIELQKQQFAELLRSRTQLCISCRSDFSNAATANVDESSTTKNDSPSSTEDSTLVVEKIWTEEDWLHQLRSAVWSLAALSSASVGDSKIVAVADCADGSVESLLGSAQQYLATYATASATPDTSSATVTAVAAAEVGAGSNTDLSPACELLVMYLTNILKNPSVPRYRRIATTNSSYMKSLLPVELHAAQLLAAVGFVKKAESTYFEYTWHNLPPAGEASKSNSSSTTSGGTSSSGKGADRAPESAQAATRLLQAAVALLAALKISRRALADLLVQQLTSIGAAAASVSATSADAAKSTDVGEPSAMVHASALPIMNVVPAVASNAAPAIGGGDDGLIAVMEVAGEEGLQAGGSVQDDSVDFMKILKKAQESKWKPT